MIIIDKSELLKAVEYLKQGKTLVFPTETSYGLGCDATNQEAVDKIFKIKGRQGDKPLLVVVPDVEMAKKYLVWNNLLDELAGKYWPGPLTVVGEYLSLRGAVSDEAIPMFGSANDGIAARVTDYPLTKLLSSGLGRPLVATSANLADAGDVYDSKKIGIKPDILIDGGVFPPNPPTPIVSGLGVNPPPSISISGFIP